MYRNADQLHDGEILKGYDICIVGAGAAGISMAQRLLGTSQKVLLVSSGLETDVGRPSPVRESIYEGTVGAFLQKVDPTFLTRSRLRMYGGTTNHFGYWARPLDEADLKPRPGYRDAQWPIDMAELNRYYPDANATGDYGPFNYDDIEFWANALGGRPFPPLPGDALENAIFHSQPDYNIHDFQLHYGPQLKAAPESKLTVLFNANILEVKSTDGKDHVTGLACATIGNDGKRGISFGVEARAYVLAQGGIEPVRLLKLSGSLGDNARGLLGRGFMVHPLITNAATVRFSQPVDMLVRNFFSERQVRIADPANANEEHQPVFAAVYHPEELLDYYIFNAWGILAPTPSTMDTERIGNFRIMLGFSSDRTRANVNVNWEQVPNENSAITLDQNRTDPVFRQPVARLDWNLLKPDKDTVRKAMNLCWSYLQPRGAIDFQMITDLSTDNPTQWTFPPNSGALMTGDHHMGALRMSKTAEDGIVNPDLRLHGVDNLYIAGCGVFPTSGYANPTLTLVALALRLADHLNGIHA